MVADDSSNVPSPFDVQTIKSLVSLMTRHDLSEIDLREGDLRIRLRRGLPVSNVAPVAFPPITAAPAPAVIPNAEPKADTPAKPLHEVKSPTIGTFYSAPSPGAEPFVHVGARLTPTTVVGIIEAMKLFSEITADCSGVVKEILVENQQPVEFGQVLFKVDPTG